MPGQQPSSDTQKRRAAQQRRAEAARQHAIAARRRRMIWLKASQGQRSRRRSIGNTGSNFLSGILSGVGLLAIVAIVLVVANKLPQSGGDQGGNDKGICASAPNGPTLTRFLQALAAQESGGNVRSVSNTGAKGKYQYIDSTWKSHAAKYYPPASKYSNALNAPEGYQDALAYIEYSDKYRTYGGDLFKLAISHFYPAANSDASLLDIVPAGNVVTPRQYASQFIAKVKGGVGSNIPIKASSAPEFKKYLGKVGGEC